MEPTHPRFARYVNCWIDGSGDGNDKPSSSQTLIVPSLAMTIHPSMFARVATFAENVHICWTMNISGDSFGSNHT